MEPAGVMGCKVQSSLPMIPLKYDVQDGAFSVWSSVVRRAIDQEMFRSCSKVDRESGVARRA
jgi:hypothetical protein